MDDTQRKAQELDDWLNAEAYAKADAWARSPAGTPYGSTTPTPFPAEKVKTNDDRKNA